MEISVKETVSFRQPEDGFCKKEDVFGYAILVSYFLNPKSQTVGVVTDQAILEFGYRTGPAIHVCWSGMLHTKRQHFCRLCLMDLARKSAWYLGEKPPILPISDHWRPNNASDSNLVR